MQGCPETASNAFSLLALQSIKIEGSMVVKNFVFTIGISEGSVSGYIGHVGPTRFDVLREDLLAQILWPSAIEQGKM